jgi:hypothetical protein
MVHVQSLISLKQCSALIIPRDEREGRQHFILRGGDMKSNQNKKRQIRGRAEIRYVILL